MENFNLSTNLVILRSLASSLLSGIRWVSFSLLLLTGLSIVTFVVCFGCGVFFWPRPVLSVGVCLVENVAAGQGRLLFFATLTYVFISQGTGMMRNLETWRGEAGSAMYTAIASGGAVNLPIPGGGGGANAEPLYPPRELDGQSPLRGWEAVSTSYFLATSASDLHAGVPPRFPGCLLSV